MAMLSGMYKCHLTDSGMKKAVVDTYKVQNLKRRLIQQYIEKIQFRPQYERNKSELVCSSMPYASNGAMRTDDGLQFFTESCGNH